MTVPYLSADDFTAQANAYACTIPTALLADTVGMAALMLNATTLIDSAMKRSFQPDAITETHQWRYDTRRIYPFQLPVASVTSITIRYSPASGDNQTVDLTKIGIFNSEGYIDVRDPNVGSIFGTDLMVQWYAIPEIELVYTSYASIPTNVAQACGWVAAQIVSEGRTDGTIAGGLQSVQVGDVKVQRAVPRGMTDPSPWDSLPAKARMLLGGRRMRLF